MAAAAAQTSLPALLDSLSQSLNSALDATPKLSGVISPSKDGVSLLDVKNELLLSYLQNLVFLILLKIRSASANARRSANKTEDGDGDENGADAGVLEDNVVVEKLVELRLYLEKGVRPLEDKLRFQLDKILRAASNADRSAHAQAQAAAESRKARDAAFESGSEDDNDSEDENEASGRNTGTTTTKDPSAKIFTPGTHGFISASKPIGMAAASAKDSKTSGVYRPPKITPTVMPTATTDRRDRQQRQPMKSATMDEYVSHELSSAPLAQPSVGADILRHGRGVKTAAQRADEDRRREYEETNFVRLPKESKKERAKRSNGNNTKMSFGGEEWRELGEGVDRIARLTGRKQGGGGGTKALLEKSRKRGRETTDSARGSGLSSGTREIIGDRFNKRVKVMEGGRRDRGKR